MNTLDLSLVNKRVLAIDYGINGGFVWNDGMVLQQVRMPESIKEKLDIIDVARPKLVVAENVHPFSKQGVVSVGTFMRQAGEIDGMCAAWSIPMKHYEPSEWQAHFTNQRAGYFASKTYWKKYLQKIAKELIGQDFMLSCADAALIWWYHNCLEQNIPSKVKLTL